MTRHLPDRVRRRLLAVVGAVLVTASTTGCATPLTETIGAGPEWGWTRQAAPLSLGVTHMEYSLAPSDPPDARARGEAILRGAGRFQNQHLMGFGVLNPEPSPGVEDWRSLDTRMALIRATGGTPVLTLAGAPDWMKGGAAGTTDWSRIEAAPLPRFYDDFARLCAKAVARYPDVRVVQVWNEFKGFYDPATNTWDAAGYTRLYDLVRAAVKAVRPDIAVGGPYIPLDAWADPGAGGAPSTLRGPWGITDRRALDVVEYWLARSSGAEFLAVDGGSGTRDAGLITSPSQGAERFGALTRWLRARSTLPIWWSEFYPEIDPTGGKGDAASPQRAAVTLETVAALARAGATTALLWQPQQSASFPYAALWTDTADGDGGRPTALTPGWTWLAPRLERGGVDLGRSPDGRLLAFRAADGMLLVNASPGALSVDGAGSDTLTLAGFGTVIVPAAA